MLGGTRNKLKTELILLKSKECRFLSEKREKTAKHKWGDREEGKDGQAQVGWREKGDTLGR